MMKYISKCMKIIFQIKTFQTKKDTLLDNIKVKRCGMHDYQRDGSTLYTKCHKSLQLYLVIVSTCNMHLYIHPYSKLFI